MPAYFRRHKSFGAQENMFRRSGGRSGGVTRTSHVCKPINGFKAVPQRPGSSQPFSTSSRFFRLYPGRKIYGPLNDSTEFNCHVAGYYRAPTSLRIAAYGLDVGSMNVESQRAKDNLSPSSGIATSRRLRTSECLGSSRRD